jgi:hypothetical protein
MPHPLLEEVKEAEVALLPVVESTIKGVAKAAKETLSPPPSVKSLPPLLPREARRSSMAKVVAVEEVEVAVIVDHEAAEAAVAVLSTDTAKPVKPTLTRRSTNLGVAMTALLNSRPK